MTIENLTIFLKDFLNNNYAHLKNENGKEVLETLEEHSLLCLDKLNFLLENVKNIKCLNDEEITLLKYATFMHDFGKSNPCFQKNKMNRKIKTLSTDSTHSIFSAYIFICFMFYIYGNRTIKDSYLTFTIFCNAYAIASHHTGFNKNITDFINSLEAISKDNELMSIIDSLSIKRYKFEVYKNIFNKCLNTRNKELCFLYNIKIRFFTSLICNADSLATNKFLSNKDSFKLAPKLDTSKYFNGNLYKSIKRYKENNLLGIKTFEDNDINKLRSDMTLEVEDVILKNNYNLYTLEGPCGCGKTNLGLLSSCLLVKNYEELKGIIYVSPFNSITDQNVEVFKGYFENIQTRTSTSEINNIDYKDDDDIENMMIDYHLDNFNFEATSHVHLFNILFGKNRNDILSFYFICNKVLVIDEIQAYPSYFWKKFMLMLNICAENLNLKSIIMSATMPNLANLNKTLRIRELILNKRKYYSNPLFKDRVKFEFIGTINSLDKIIKDENFYNDKKVFYEFITKKTASKFYKILLDKFPSKKVLLLDGDTNKSNRLKVIEEVKNSESIILVSTQVIEAGVDLDFDFGFKDTSLPDSEIQFLGRINRSCQRKNCYAIFFDYDSKRLYKKDYRSLSNIREKEIQEAIKNFDNELLYEKTLKSIENNDDENKIIRFCFDFDFVGLEKEMKLIESNLSLYVAYEMELLKDEIPSSLIDIIKNISSKYKFEIIKEEENNFIIDGKELWNLYEYVKNINRKDISFNEKRYFLHNLNILKNYFTFSFFENKKLDTSRINQIGESRFYYTENDDFIIDGRFNRDLLIKDNPSTNFY